MEEYKRLEACAEDCAAVTKHKAESCQYEIGFQRIDEIGNGAMATVFGGAIPVYTYLAAEEFANGQTGRGIVLVAASVAYSVFGFLFGRRAWQHKKQIDGIKQIKQGLEKKLE